jgi:hypothetical protein
LTFALRRPNFANHPPSVANALTEATTMLDTRLRRHVDLLAERRLAGEDEWRPPRTKAGKRKKGGKQTRAAGGGVLGRNVQLIDQGLAVVVGLTPIGGPTSLAAFLQEASSPCSLAALAVSLLRHFSHETTFVSRALFVLLRVATTAPPAASSPDTASVPPPPAWSQHPVFDLRGVLERPQIGLTSTEQLSPQRPPEEAVQAALEVFAGIPTVYRGRSLLLDRLVGLTARLLRLGTRPLGKDRGGTRGRDAVSRRFSSLIFPL